MASEKKYYRVSISDADCINSGYALLTREEAELVRKATSPGYWIHPVTEGFVNGFFIDMNHPMTEDEMEMEYKEYSEADQGDEDDYDSCPYANYYEYTDEDAERDGLLEYGLL